MSAEDRSSASTTDLWNVLLGIAVIALAGVSTMGWVEMRRLDDRIARLEGPATATVAGGGNAVEPQFTRLRTSITIRDSAFKGDPAAAIVIVEFSDFQCPFCARHFRDTFKRIDERFIATGMVRYVFRHLPLEDIHPQAFMASAIAECSRRQGLLWDIHDQLFRRQRELPALDLPAHAVASGVERGRLDDCLGGSGREQVLRDVTDARGLGIAGTPRFFVGRATPGGTLEATHSIDGARPFEVFESVLIEVMRSN